MGGFNSGRPRTHRLVENCLALDAAFLRRIGCLQGLARRRLSWFCNGMESATATIEVTVFGKERPRAVLRMDGLAPQTILLASTRPNLGGERWWFVCPETGRRCRVLYLTTDGDRFVSRQAANLVYRSNGLGLADSIQWRACSCETRCPERNAKAIRHGLGECTERNMIESSIDYARPTGLPNLSAMRR